MKLRNFTTLIFIICFAQVIYSQCDDDILGTSIFVRQQDPAPYTILELEEQADKISKTLDCYNNAVEPKLKARMAFLIANRYYYLNHIDSVNYYLEVSYNTNYEWFRKKIEYHYINIECSEYVRKNIGPFFILDNRISDRYMEKCQIDTLELKEEAVRRLLENSQKEIPEYLKNIFERDQEERVKDSIDWSYQRILDEENRRELDMLLASNKLEYTRESLDIVWFVVQHSTDCKWTMKWFEFLLERMDFNQYKGNFLQFTFQRFFDAKKGYCYEKDELETIEYLTRIRQKYSDNRITKIISN